MLPFWLVWVTLFVTAQAELCRLIWSIKSVSCAKECTSGYKVPTLWHPFSHWDKNLRLRAYPLKWMSPEGHSPDLDMRVSCGSTAPWTTLRLKAKLLKTTLTQAFFLVIMNQIKRHSNALCVGCVPRSGLLHGRMWPYTHAVPLLGIALPPHPSIRPWRLGARREVCFGTG